jgi:hypothetical protein
MSDVVPCRVCRNCVCISLIGAPSAHASDAAAWRRSWGRSGRTPARLQTASHHRLTFRGSIAVPTDVVNTRSGSTHTRAASRSRFCPIRNCPIVGVRPSGTGRPASTSARMRRRSRSADRRGPRRAWRVRPGRQELGGREWRHDQPAVVGVHRRRNGGGGLVQVFHDRPDGSAAGEQFVGKVLRRLLVEVAAGPYGLPFAAAARLDTPRASGPHRPVALESDIEPRPRCTVWLRPPPRHDRHPAIRTTEPPTLSPDRSVGGDQGRCLSPSAP